MTIQELTTEALNEAIIRAQQYLLNVPQVQQELQLMLQEKQKREEQVKKESDKNAEDARVRQEIIDEENALIEEVKEPKKK